MELRSFFSVLWQRLWLIVLATVLVAGMTFYLSIRMTPVYEATATLRIDPGSDPQTDLYSVLRSSEMLATTYVEQIQDPVMLRAVIAKLGLAMSTGALSDALTVEQVRDTQLIKVAAESTDPGLAQALAQTVVQTFIETETGRQQARFQEGLADIEAQVAEVKATIEATQKAIASLGDPADPENLRIPEFARLEMARLQSQLSSDQVRQTILLRSTEDFRLAMTQYTDYLTVFSPAELPTQAVRPRVTLNTVLGVISGVVLGVSTTFLLTYLDDTIRTPEDVKRHLPLELLGTVPQFGRSRDRFSLVVVDHPLEPVSEAIRSLRTTVLFATLDDPSRRILITSPLPTEGKSFTAANLAASLAQGGHNVILLDADLRHPTVQNFLEVEREPGLTTALLDPSQREQVLRESGIDGLRVVTAGEHVENPAELLTSKTFQAFVAWLTEQADVVIFDSPPVLPVADAAILSRQVDGVMMILDCGETRRNAAQQALERLGSVGARVLGGVLNRLDTSADGYYYYYHTYPQHSAAGARKSSKRRRRAQAKEQRTESGGAL